MSTAADWKARLEAKLESRYEAREAQTITRLLLADSLRCEPAEVSLHLQQRLSEPALQRLEDAEARLLTGEPVQYVIGEAPFMDFRLKVGPSVLIPRPETEELVRWAEDLLGVECRSRLRILDVGTGAGNIAIAMARRCPVAEVWASDVSQEALELARQNAAWVGGEEMLSRMHFHHGDLTDLGSYAELPLMDVMFCNPPYVSEDEWPSLAEHVRDHEPGVALFAPADDPLFYFRHLASLAKEKLKPAGHLFVEIHSAMAEQTARLFREAGFSQIENRRDFQRRERMLHIRP